MFDYKALKQLLENRVILVTGAGNGIGRAASLAYARHGATVILCGRTVANLEQTWDAIDAEGLPEAIIHPLDLQSATANEYTQLSELLSAEFGCLHGILHNASLLGQRTPIESYSEQAWNQVLQVNVTAAFQLTKALLPLLKQAEDAALVFTSSGVGRRGRAYWGAYAVSKFATEGLVQVLADELTTTSAIRVNCINPGATNTQMRRDAYPAEEPTKNPLPEQIMPLYLYLMGPESAGVNGQSLDAQ